MKSLIRHLFHYGAYVLGAIVIVVSITALVLRFAIIPEIDQYKDDIEVAASRAIGVPVQITAIEADWWHLNPRISLRGVNLSPPGRPASLRLSRIDATASWLSLLLLEPHLSKLVVHQPNLEIRRDAAGKFFIAGIPINMDGAPSPFPDWLLRQQTVSVSEGRLTWIDEMRGAPPLVLEQVYLVVHNHFGRHRFGLIAQPPAAAGHRIDLRGDLSGSSVHKPASWAGQLYMAWMGASAMGLNTWSPWAQSAVRRSQGDLRFWLDVDRGQFKQLLGDVMLRDVAVSLADALPDMAFRQISGRMGWRREGADQTYFVEKLRFVTSDGHSAEPANVQVTVRPTPEGKLNTARVKADSLRLEALTALTGSLPLPKTGHDWIARLNPRGFVEHLDLDWLGKERFRLQARFREGGINTTANLPGFSGLSGVIDTSEESGSARLTSQGLHLDYGPVFRQPLAFSNLNAELNWTGNGQGGQNIRLKNLEIANADLDGSAVGEVFWLPGQAPVIDLKAHLKRGQGNAIWRYLPQSIAVDAYTWLKRGLVDGVAEDTRLVLRGALDQFPFEQGNGEFHVDVPLHNVTLDYAPNWPRISGINGQLTFKGRGMSINADTGEVNGVRLNQVRGYIPDLHHSANEMLVLDGQAKGPTADFLEFVRHSPISAHTGEFTDALRAQGEASLRLQLRLPLRRSHDSRVTGRIALTNNQVDLGGKLPSLSQVTGELGFTEGWVKANNLTALLDNQPVSLNLASESGGRVRASLRGTVSASGLAHWLPGALASRLKGRTEAKAELIVQQQDMAIQLKSNLVGLAVDLPAPLGKKAEQALPLSLDSLPGSAAYRFQYGAHLSGALALPEKDPPRIGLAFGGQQASLPVEAGLTVLGNMRQLDLDEWLDLDFGAGSGEAALPIQDINLSFFELKVLDRKLRDIQVRAKPVKETWQVKLTGQHIQGEVEYGPRVDQPGKRFYGRFTKLAIPKEAPGSRETPGKPKPVSSSTSLGELPAEVDLNADAFSFGGRELGALDLNFQVEKNGLRIETLKLHSAYHQLEAGGWLSASPLRATHLDVKLTSPNLGRLMNQLGFVEAIKGGDLRVNGNLEWLGRPEDFKLAQLGGHLDVNIRNGRFTQLDPGAGKLLGILSLQALPRRIALDFRDIFSEGLAFDEIKGGVHLQRGAGYLPGMTIHGPAAKIRMNGKIDLARENQELRLLIQPRLDEGVAVGAALLGGPVAGVGALVASKLLRDPIAKAASFEYLVTGTWDDPLVKKLPKAVVESPVISEP